MRTVTVGAKAAVGQEPGNWVPYPVVPTVAHGTTSAVGTTQLEEAYAVAYEEYLEKIKEHDLVKDAYVQWTSNQMASFTRFMMTGVREEPLPEPPHPGPTPVFPSKEEFYIMYKRQRQLTPGLGESGNDAPDGTPMHPGRCSPGASAEPRHGSASGGSRRGSTSPSTVEIQRPHFTHSELDRLELDRHSGGAPP
ncbi:uncharacterized protein [Lolium perenne]|uniref:uncharacterized protein n=1 Tax=Lolium perenne TaxID=4522 RepID=UPI003A9A24D9